jgi:uncharacterized repeat protein (TIGR02543 family)
MSNFYININVSSSVAVYAGLFGYIGSGGVISNLGVSGSVSAINTGSGFIYAGAIAGVVNAGSISRSYSSATVSAICNSEAHTGAIAGQSGSGGSITNCYNTGAVSATYMGSSNGGVLVGGIVGGYSGFGDSSITDSYNTGMVTASSPTGTGVVYAGGIAGAAAPITRSYNIGAVNASGGSSADIHVGGIAGNNTGTITTSYYNNEKFAGDAVGNGNPLGYAASLTTAQMTDDAVLSGAVGLGTTNFTKRLNDTANGIRYYPELTVFYNSANPATADASRLSVAISETLPPSEPKAIYKATYDYQGATGDDGVRFDLIEANHTFRLAVPTKTYYDFVGWYDAVSDGTKYTDDGGAGLFAWNVADKTLYARWSVVVYDIIYNLNGGINPVDAPTTYTGESATTLPTPTRTGYNFGGWYETAGFTGDAVTGISAGTTGSKEFWASWTESAEGETKYTITYHNVLAAEHHNPATYTAGDLPITFSGAGERDGYEFVGWYDNVDLGGDAVTGISAGSTGNKQFWAKWTPTEIISDPYKHLDDLTIPLLIILDVTLLFAAIRMVCKAIKKDAAIAAIEAAVATTAAAKPAPKAEATTSNGGNVGTVGGGSGGSATQSQNHGQNSFGGYGQGAAPYGANPYRPNPYMQQQNPPAPRPNMSPPYGQPNPYGQYDPYNQNGGR